MESATPDEQLDIGFKLELNYFSIQIRKRLRVSTFSGHEELRPMRIDLNTSALLSKKRVNKKRLKSSYIYLAKTEAS